MLPKTFMERLLVYSASLVYFSVSINNRCNFNVNVIYNENYKFLGQIYRIHLLPEVFPVCENN
jgi:hypothetical protein